MWPWKNPSVCGGRASLEKNRAPTVVSCMTRADGVQPRNAGWPAAPLSV